MPPRPPPVFDPRLVPVVPGAASAGLSAVPTQRLTPEGLRQRFARPPAWTPELVQERRLGDRAPAAAAVLLPLVMRERLYLLLTQRTAHLSTHSGQIAFPGGKVDAGDRDATAAALREAEEETGLPASHVEVLGTLPQYITGTQYFVTPVVALVSPGFTLKPNPHEVDEVFEVPLDHLMDPGNHQRHAFDWDGVRREWYSMPYRDGAREHFIWGATAGMLRNFYHLLRA